MVGVAVALLVLAASASAATLRLTATRRIDSRLYELTFTTPAFTSPTKVRILLPAGYQAHPHRRYPVLYLLHGSVGDYSDWTVKGNAEQATAGLPLIVVMPNAGNGGFYSDWYNGGAFGPPEWETYHIYQLLPWVDAHYRTIATRAGRATAGLSMGGFGAMSYPARHPDLFVAAASFSGAIDTNYPEPAGEPDESTFDGGMPYATWGPRQTEEVRWRAHNPWDLAGNLRGLNLTIRTGNGQPGGPYPYDPAAGAVESYVHQASIDLHDRLLSLGIPHLWQDYGPGDHSWPYWDRDLVETLPTIMATFRHPPAPPSPFTFTAVEPSYEIFGWHVTITRPALEFSTLGPAGPHGFRLTGSGSAQVLTAPLYRRNHSYPVVVRDGNGTRRFKAHSDAHGRLRFHVYLGPPNPYQEYTAQANSAGTRSYTASVTVTGGPRRPGANRRRLRSTAEGVR